VRSFLLQPEVIHCGLASFALAYVLEKAGKPVVDFPVFVDVLSRFSAKASRHEKVRRGVPLEWGGGCLASVFFVCRLRTLTPTLTITPHPIPDCLWREG